VGFGIAGGDQARAVARLADGVVVGSALVERLGQGLEPARALMRELRGALDGAVTQSGSSVPHDPDP
jgi:tryptophan synthase alpha chain